MEERAKVIEVSGNRIKLKFQRQEACLKCGACSQKDDNSMILEIPNTIGAKLHDEVIVKLESSQLRFSGMLYGIPSAAIIAGVFSGYYLFHSEVAGIAGGAILGCIATITMAVHCRKYKPIIKKVTQEKPEQDRTS